MISYEKRKIYEDKVNKINKIDEVRYLAWNRSKKIDIGLKNLYQFIKCPKYIFIKISNHIT